MDKQSDSQFKVLASLCGSCGCGCPTVFESENGEDMVIVGKHDEIVLENTAINQKIGDGETAVVIPKSILLEAMKLIK